MACKFCKNTFSDYDINEDLISYYLEFNGNEIGGNYVVIDDEGNGDPVLRNVIYFGDISDADSRSVKINYCPVCGRKLEKEELE